MDRLARFFLLAVTIACLTSTGFAQEKSVGVIVPLTGPYAHFGEAGRIGIEMALEGSTNTHSQVQFIYEDSEYDAAKAVSAFKKLVEVDRASALIVLGSPPSSSVIPLAEAKRIPVFAWTPSKKLTAGRAGVVRLMTSAAEQGTEMAAEVRERAYPPVAFFAAQNEFSQSVRDGFIADIGASSVLLNEEFLPTEQDFRSALVRLRPLAIKSVGVCLNTGQIPTFLDQLRRQGYKGPVFGCHAMSSAAILTTLKTNGLSGWFVEGLITKHFENTFDSRSPDSSGIWLAAAFHDVALLVSRSTLDQNLISRVTSKPIEGSAFGRSVIVKGADDTYLETSLGITKMNEGRFVREYQ